MKIQIISDLHFDRMKIGIRDSIVETIVNPAADFIVLAGDIAEGGFMIQFLHELKKTRKKAIFVPGNHDYWNEHVNCYAEKTKELFSAYDNIALFNEYVIIEDVLFVGGTLWTDISHPIDANIVQMLMYDFRKVRGISTQWWLNQHLEAKHVIEETLKFPDFQNLKKIVVTHHSPSFKTCPQKYKFESSNCGYYSDLEQIMHEDWAPDIWIHGHVHEACDVVIGKTRIIRNPFGYVTYDAESTGFNKDFLIDTNDLNSYLHPDQFPGRTPVVEDPFGLLTEVPEVQSGI